jgi:hypothetical protein
MDNRDEQIALTVELPAGVSAPRVTRAGGQDLELRGRRDEVGALLVRAFTGLTGDSMVPALTVDEIVCAIRTLGKCAALGLDVDLVDELDEQQQQVADRVGRLYTARDIEWAATTIS